MANSSYCRFENTLSDLHDCNESLITNPQKRLSEYEWEAFLEMIELCGEMHKEYKHLLED